MFPASTQVRVKSQLLADPGLPASNPTLPTWQQPAHALASTQSDTLVSKADYTIIGSGVTGCSVAKHILEDPRSGSETVVVLEARTLVSGATSRNAGFLQSHVPKQFRSMVERFGKDEAIAIAHFCKQTLEKMRNLAESGGPELLHASELRPVECAAVFQDQADLDDAIQSIQLYEETFPKEKGIYRAFNKEECKAVSIITFGRDIFRPLMTASQNLGLRDAVGALSAHGAVFWPYRLITGVFERLLQQNKDRLGIETNTPVTSVAFSPDTDAEYPYILATPRGEIRTRHVFHCTNAYASHLIPSLRCRVFPTRHTMSCQQQGPQFPNMGDKRSWMFYGARGYDAETGVLETGVRYMQQNARTGDLFFGGDGDTLEALLSCDDSLINTVSTKYLSSQLPHTFLRGWQGSAAGETEAPEVKNVWSGIIGNTPDRVPLVGRLVNGDPGAGKGTGQWVAAGFNGYGMPQCWSSGEAIAKMALGDDIPSWLPKVCLSTEERLARLDVDAAVKALL